MKELRICFEIEGLAVDKYGEPCAGGVDITLGEVPEDKFQERYNRLIKSLEIEQVLRLACMDSMFDETDCRIISPEEYDRLYGDEEER